MPTQPTRHASRFRLLGLLPVFVAILLYAAADLLLLSGTGTAIHPLYIVPLALSAWAGGLIVALFAALLSLPLHFVLAVIAGVSPGSLLATGSYLTLSAAYVTVAVVAGRLSDLRLQLREEVDRRKRTEAALHESETRFELFMDHIPAQVFINDSNHHALFVNKEHDRVYGSLEHLSKHIGAFLNADELRVIEEANNRALEEGHQVLDVTATDSNGEERFYQTYLFPIPREGQSPLLGGISIDLTDWYRAQEKLREAAEEKELLLREIHHRVRNNLAVIGGLIRLRKAHLSEPTAAEICTEIEQRINAITVVHEKLYRTEEMKEIDFESYVRDVGRYLLYTLADDSNRIQFTVTAEHVYFSVETLVPLGIILTELVTNAIRHAFPEGDHGRISVRAVRHDQACSISVEDSGVGLPPGFDPEQSATLGYQLITALTKQLNGTLEIGGTEGTAVILSIPAAELDP